MFGRSKNNVEGVETLDMRDGYNRDFVPPTVSHRSAPYDPYAGCIDVPVVMEPQRNKYRVDDVPEGDVEIPMSRILQMMAYTVNLNDWQQEKVANNIINILGLGKIYNRYGSQYKQSMENMKFF